MQSAQAILNLISGKKTYAVAIAGGVLLFGSWQQWWVLPKEANTALMLLMGAFIRSGVAQAQNQKTPKT